jgi:hypothetical protein
VLDLLSVREVHRHSLSLCSSLLVFFEIDSFFFFFFFFFCDSLFFFFFFLGSMGVVKYNTLTF